MGKKTSPNSEQDVTNGRRNFLRKTAAFGVGAASVSSLVRSSNVVRADRSTPYDGNQADPVYADGELIAEVHSSVTGPKQIESTIDNVNIGVGFPFTTQQYQDSFTVYANNLQVEVDSVSTPGSYDLKNVSTHRQGSNSNWEDEVDSILKYAFNAAWSVGTSVSPLPAPSPYELIMNDSGTNVDDSFNQNNFTAKYGKVQSGGVGLKYETDFYVNNGDVPTGTWDFEVTCRADFGFTNVCWSPSCENGFNKLADVSQTHDVSIEVVDP
ncbi:hypothetical protein [Halorussus salinus]|uniref:hypothetical protein n=1 Tax=Halorussus salinus TaxID=1364935 RepID=UPI0010925EFA|nr:hypothetical protein [Halorussus salinus]